MYHFKKRLKLNIPNNLGGKRYHHDQPDETHGPARHQDLVDVGVPVTAAVPLHSRVCLQQCTVGKSQTNASLLYCGENLALQSVMLATDTDVGEGEVCRAEQ